MREIPRVVRSRFSQYGFSVTSLGTGTTSARMRTDTQRVPSFTDVPAGAEPQQQRRAKRCVVIEHIDIIGEQFWRSNPHVLGRGDGSCGGGGAGGGRSGGETLGEGDLGR